METLCNVGFFERCGDFSDICDFFFANEVAENYDFKQFRIDANLEDLKNGEEMNVNFR